MKKILYYGLWGVVLYVGVNWVADNPRAVQRFRRAMNDCVSLMGGHLNEIIDSGQKAVSQSLDK